MLEPLPEADAIVSTSFFKNVTLAVPEAPAVARVIGLPTKTVRRGSTIGLHGGADAALPTSGPLPPPWRYDDRYGYPSPCTVSLAEQGEHSNARQQSLHPQRHGPAPARNAHVGLPTRGLGSGPLRYGTWRIPRGNRSSMSCRSWFRLERMAPPRRSPSRPEGASSSNTLRRLWRCSPDRKRIYGSPRPRAERSLPTILRAARSAPGPPGST